MPATDAETTIQMLEHVLNTECEQLADELRNDADSYALDRAILVFQRWLRYEDAREGLTRVYGPGLGYTIETITSLLDDGALADKDQFCGCVRALAFQVGPRAIELCPSAMTPCCCCTD